jgi:uncharacterized membrane protein
MNPWEIHPLLVHFPIALLLAATALDVLAIGQRRSDFAWAAAGLLIAGEVSALGTIAAGFLAYFTVPTHSEEAHVRMLIHPVLAGAATLVYALVAVPRWRRRKAIPSRTNIMFSLVAAGLLIASGALGGYLVFHDGVGVEPESRAIDHTHTH